MALDTHVQGKYRMQPDRDTFQTSSNYRPGITERSTRFTLRKSMTVLQTNYYNLIDKLSARGRLKTKSSVAQGPNDYQVIVLPLEMKK